MVKLHESFNETTTVEGCTFLPKQVYDLFRIETLFLRQNIDIVITLHVPIINVQYMFTIYRHLSVPSSIPQASSKHEKIINMEIFLIFLPIQPFLAFNEEALFITNKHELIAICKDNTFKVIF
jgi:hypothetical protein